MCLGTVAISRCYQPWLPCNNNTNKKKKKEEEEEEKKRKKKWVTVLSAP